MRLACLSNHWLYWLSRPWVSCGSRTSLYCIAVTLLVHYVLRYVIIIKPQEHNDRDWNYVKAAVYARASYGNTIHGLRRIFRLASKIVFSNSDSSVCKSRLIHRTKVNEFFSRQETRVKSAWESFSERISSRLVMPGMAPCLGTVSVIA